MAIPFDSLCLAAVVSELQGLVGAKVQAVHQPAERAVVFTLYERGERHLLLSADARFARTHFISKKQRNADDPGAFLSELRKHLGGGRLVGARQRGFDRILELAFGTAEGEWTLIAELMGKHSNLMLVGQDGRLAGALQWIGPGKSKRLVLPNRRYEPPPLAPRPSILDAHAGDSLEGREGVSPFLLRLMNETALSPDLLRATIEASRFEPVFCAGAGAYPISVSGLEIAEERTETYSLAAERWFADAVQVAAMDQAQRTLLGQLERVLLARDVALSQLHQAADTAARARDLQLQGELILAYQTSIEPGECTLEATDYQGEAVQISINADLTPVENAQRFFDKAKRAKRGAEGVHTKITSLESDRTSLRSVIELLRKTSSMEELGNLRREADERGWLHHQPAPTRSKEERPYQGHSVRETTSPAGWKVLYGDNATSNDYLTTRVAKPNDWWLHVRGSSSAHVVIATGNNPEKVQREDLMFAARLAVRNSPSKHASYVPVDYCLKKYVRKPRGSAPGAALYEREKTLFVDEL